MNKIKAFIKLILIKLSLRHPSRGIKVSNEQRAYILLGYKNPSIDTFIETGTYKGDMVEMMKHHFKKIYSIEFYDELYQKAKDRFLDDAHVKIIHGDSANKLKKILSGGGYNTKTCSLLA